jgi:hypothetical protein
MTQQAKGLDMSVKNINTVKAVNPLNQYYVE